MATDRKILPALLAMGESRPVGVRYPCLPMLERLRLLDLRSRIIYKKYCSSFGNGLLRVSMLDGNILGVMPLGPLSEASAASLVTVFQVDRSRVEPDAMNSLSPVHGPSHFELHVAI